VVVERNIKSVVADSMIPRDMRKRYEAYIASPKWKQIREEAIVGTTGLLVGN
jgi:hypothetical protein